MPIKYPARALLTLIALAMSSCGTSEKPQPKPAAASTTQAAQVAPVADSSKAWRIDLDGMLERRLVRILVPYSKTFYFIDQGQQRGMAYEVGVELEKDLNSTNKDRSRPIRVVFIPTTRDQLMQRLADGFGDIAAGNLTITPERLKLVDFTAPLGEGVSEILVTAKGVAAPTSADGLAGTEVYVRRSSSYYESLTALNASLAARKLKPVEIRLAEDSLEDEDILEMLNAGLVSATIVDSHIATFWRQIFEQIEPHPEITLRTGGQIAWAIRKQSPQLKTRLDAFVAKNRAGTSTGNVILKRYLRDTKWAKRATDASDMQRFGELAKYFQRYAAQYGFEWLMVVAQGYQESGLDQSVKSRVGAIGVMQVMPATARDPNVNIHDINLVESNIHAGIKYLRFLVEQYFDDPAIDQVNRHLFAFAAYNAGPARVSRLRTKAAAQGLDPNKWFNNVELVAAQDIGRETVQYVSNIYKYYIAYKLVLEHSKRAAQAKAPSRT